MSRAAACARCAAAAALLACCALRAFPDVSVVRGGGPDFPLDVDSVYFFVWHDTGKTTDSVITPLPASLYAELRDNIDSVYNYATALSLHRKELAGCPRGRTATRPYSACLTFYTLGTPSLKVLFSCGNYASGKLVTAADRYPFVVKFTKGFAGKLRKLAGGK